MKDILPGDLCALRSCYGDDTVYLLKDFAPAVHFSEKKIMENRDVYTVVCTVIESYPNKGVRIEWVLVLSLRLGLGWTDASYMRGL